MFNHVYSDSVKHTNDYYLNRIKSEDFTILQENIGQPIQIADNVQLQRSRTERFVEVFREQVSQNPVYNGYTAAEVIWSCIKIHIYHPPTKCIVSSQKPDLYFGLIIIY